MDDRSQKYEDTVGWSEECVGEEKEKKKKKTGGSGWGI